VPKAGALSLGSPSFSILVLKANELESKRSFLAVLKSRGQELLGTFRVRGINLVRENVVGVGAGDGKIQAR
jgi:hypothetical protein